MRLLSVVAVCALGISSSDVVTAQGPIREGLRRTGELAVEGTRNLAQGAANATRAVGNAALTPAIPFQAQAGANLSVSDQGRDARWRFNRHNGEWWYYSPDNNWMYHRDGQWQAFNEGSFEPIEQNQQFADQSQFNQGQFQQGQYNQGQQYSAGYRGDMGQSQQFAHQQVRIDRHGRQYICENGRPVYLDQGQHVQGHHGDQQFDGQQMNHQLHGQQNYGAPTPAVPTNPNEHSVQRQDLDQQGAVQGLNQQDAAAAADAHGAAHVDATQQAIPQQNAVPASPSPAAGAAVSGDADGDAEVSVAPVGDPATVDSQAQGDPAAPREINNNPTPQTHGAVEQ